jgi:hypothetical protein
MIYNFTGHRHFGTGRVNQRAMFQDVFGEASMRRGNRRVEEGRLAGTYRQPAVSLPRSSNRTCPFRASGFPTDFTN